MPNWQIFQSCIYIKEIYNDFHNYSYIYLLVNEAVVIKIEFISNTKKLLLSTTTTKTTEIIIILGTPDLQEEVKKTIVQSINNISCGYYE
jgi:hypothetical protein